MATSPPFLAVYYDADNDSYKSLGLLAKSTNKTYHGIGIIECEPIVDHSAVDNIVVIRSTGVYHHGVPIVVCRFVGWEHYLPLELVLKHDGSVKLPWDVPGPEKIARTASVPPSTPPSRIQRRAFTP